MDKMEDNARMKDREWMEEHGHWNDLDREFFEFVRNMA